MLSGLPVLTFSQQNTVSSGNTVQGSNGSVSYSIGQIDYISTTNSNGSTSQGVQQPYEFYQNVGLNEESLIVNIFPNPTTNAVQLTLSNYSNVSFQLTDQNGKVVMEDEISSENTTIEMQGLAASSYYLLLKKDGKTIETTKIIKN